VRVGVLIKERQLKTTRFKFHMIDHQTTTFHVQNLHTGTGPIDENVYVTILYVATHQVGHHPAKGVKAPAHIGR